jgi:NDP-sugar pyrophosphorylase family protein
MKAIILAAGKGTRMLPLTETTPKPLVNTPRNQKLLELIIEALPPQVEELVLVVGYLGDQIKEHFGSSYTVTKRYSDRKSTRGVPIRSFPVQYVVQEKAEGTYRALELCRPLLQPGERFMMIYADDVYNSATFAQMIQCEGITLLATEVGDPRKFGVLEVNEQGLITNIEEKPTEPKSNIVSTGAMILDTRVFEFEPPKGPKGEYVLADAVGLMVKAGIPVKAVQVPLQHWTPIASPEDLPKLDRRRKSRPIPMTSDVSALAL